MIHKALIFFSILLGLVSIQVKANAPFDVEIHTGMGNTQGTLVWNIAGGSDGPNILSELTYKDVKFTEYTAQANIKFIQSILRNYDLFMSYSSGVAVDGSVQDSDYEGDNRNQEYSRSKSSAESSTMRNFELGAGYEFAIFQHQVIKPMLAYTFKQQNMVMTEGEQVLDTSNPLNIGPFRNTLNSQYNAEWQGAWMGLQWGLQTLRHDLQLTAKYFWLDYHAEADWNLRSDFAHPKSFEQWATGTGTGLTIFYRYNLSQVFSFWLNWSQENWATAPGQDVVYFADGSNGRTRLNEVSWKSTSMTTGLVVRF